MGKGGNVCVFVCKRVEEEDIRKMPAFVIHVIQKHGKQHLYSYVMVK